MENMEFVFGVVALLVSGFICHLFTSKKKKVSKPVLRNDDITLENIVKLLNKK